MSIALINASTYLPCFLNWDSQMLIRMLFCHAVHFVGDSKHEYYTSFVSTSIHSLSQCELAISHFFNWLVDFLLRPRERFRSTVMSTSVYMCMCVCLSVRKDIYRTTRAILTKSFACCLWPWLDPPPASLQYIMYFSFCGWHHAFFIMGRITVWSSLQRTDFA